MFRLGGTASWQRTSTHALCVDVGPLFKSPDSKHAANPQLPPRLTSSAEQTENYFGYFMVNEETFVGEGGTERKRAVRK